MNLLADLKLRRVDLPTGVPLNIRGLTRSRSPSRTATEPPVHAERLLDERPR
jgi:hypothetical protein